MNRDLEEGNGNSLFLCHNPNNNWKLCWAKLQSSLSLLKTENLRYLVYVGSMPNSVSLCGSIWSSHIHCYKNETFHFLCFKKLFEGVSLESLLALFSSGIMYWCLHVWFVWVWEIAIRNTWRRLWKSQVKWEYLEGMFRMKRKTMQLENMM